MPEAAVEPLPARGELNVRNKRIAWGERTYIMGVINVTPDSFSGDGVGDVDSAVRRGLELLSAGADILDVGGESTRPGYKSVSEDEEAVRVLPVIARLRDCTDALISIDTLKSAVFTKALSYGADILNTVAVDCMPLIHAAAEAGAPVVITHNQVGTTYSGRVVEVVLNYLSGLARQAVDAGLPASHVLIDPGFGFGKTAEQNLQLLSALSEFAQLPYPLLVGTSRKSTLGALTGRPVDQREYATAATVALAVAAGVDVVRVHDVQATKDVVAVADAVIRRWRPEGW